MRLAGTASVAEGAPRAHQFVIDQCACIGPPEGSSGWTHRQRGGSGCGGGGGGKACLCIGAAQLELGTYAAARGAAPRDGGGAQGASNAPLHLACRPAVGGFGRLRRGRSTRSGGGGGGRRREACWGREPRPKLPEATPQWRWHARGEREAAARTQAEATRARALLGREFPLGLSAQQLREELTLARRVPPRAGAPRPSQHLHSSRPHPPPFSLPVPQPQLADLAPSLAAPLPSPPTPLSLAALAAPSAALPGSAYPSGLSNDLATTGSRLQPCVLHPEHHAPRRIPWT